MSYEYDDKWTRYSVYCGTCKHRALRGTAAAVSVCWSCDFEASTTKQPETEMLDDALDVLRSFEGIGDECDYDAVRNRAFETVAEIEAARVA